MVCEKVKIFFGKFYIAIVNFLKNSAFHCNIYPLKKDTVKSVQLLLYVHKKDLGIKSDFLVSLQKK